MWKMAQRKAPHARKHAVPTIGWAEEVNGSWMEGESRSPTPLRPSVSGSSRRFSPRCRSCEPSAPPKRLETAQEDSLPAAPRHAQPADVSVSLRTICRSTPTGKSGPSEHLWYSFDGGPTEWLAIFAHYRALSG